MSISPRWLLLALTACGEVHPSRDPRGLPDATPDDPGCIVPTVHATIQAAIDDPACARVTVMPGTYSENLAIARDLVLTGSSRDAVILDGANRGSVLSLTGGTAALEHLTLRNGRAPDGGAIASHAALTLRDVLVQSSTATQRGGGIFSDGPSLTLESTVVAGNHVVPDAAMAAGGGIYVATGPLTITGGSVEGNDITAMAPLHDITAFGAGIATDDSVSLTGTSVRSNVLHIEAMGTQLVRGGGVYAKGTATLTDATLSANTIFVTGELVTAGGGGLAAGSVVAMKATIEANAIESFTGGGANATTKGGGIYLFGNAASRIEDGTLIENTLTMTTSIEGGEVVGGGLVREGMSDLEIVASTFRDNTIKGVGAEISARGGAIEWAPDSTVNGGNLTIAKSTLSTNSVKSFYALGGGISIVMRTSTHKVRITDTTIDNNSIDGIDDAQGGGVRITTGHPNGLNTLALSSSTISNNRAKVTGAVGALCTGGALFADTSVPNKLVVQVASSTIQGNFATGSAGTGGIHSRNLTPGLTNTILAGNNGSVPDCAPGVFAGYSLIGNATGCTVSGPGSNQIGAPANLGPLTDNGGPTRTHALLAGSAALDAGDPLGCSDDVGQLIRDQRGMPRIQNDRCDIGAFER